VIVLDTGIGSKPIYPWLGGGFRSSLLSKGVTPEDVTDVVFSHLHLDHIGWAAQHGKPFFSNATYRCDRRDWDFFVSPDYDIPSGSRPRRTRRRTPPRTDLRRWPHAWSSSRRAGPFPRHQHA